MRIDYLGFPRHVQMQTHARCNMACSICPHPDLERNKDRRQLRWQQFTSIIDECLAADEFESIVLDLQNEPLLDGELADRIRYIRTNERRRTFIGITTNGLALTPGALAALVESGIDRVVVSLNALDADTFAQLVPKVKFEKVLGNIEDALQVPKAKDVLKFSFGASKHNKKQLGDFATHMERQQFQYRVFALHDRLKQVVGDFLDVDRERICHLPLYSMAILLDGTAILCCQDWIPERTMGNVLREGIRGVWTSSEYQRIRINIVEQGELPTSPCKNCEAPHVNNSSVPFNYQQLSKLRVNYFVQGAAAPQSSRGSQPRARLVVVPHLSGYAAYVAPTGRLVPLSRMQAEILERLMNGSTGASGFAGADAEVASAEMEALLREAEAPFPPAWRGRLAAVAVGGVTYEAAIVDIVNNRVFLRMKECPDVAKGAEAALAFALAEGTVQINVPTRIGGWHEEVLELEICMREPELFPSVFSLEGGW